MIPLPKNPAVKAQLWNDFKGQAPDIVSTIDALRAQFPGTRLVGITLNGQQHGDPIDPEKIFVITREFIDNRLSASERDQLIKEQEKFREDNLTPFERAVLAKQKLKGKKK